MSATDALSYINKAKEEISTLYTSITDPGLKLTKDQMTKLLNKLSNLSGTMLDVGVKVGILEGQVKSYEHMVSSKVIEPNSSHESSNSSNLTMCEAADELEERKKRSKNLIIFNFPESSACSQIDKITDDTTRISTTLTTLNSTITQANITTFRLGIKKPDKSRPLKVILDNPTQAIDILRKKNNITEYPGIKIYSDQTPAQRNYLANLRLTLDQRTQNGETGLTIKYKNNKPTIVNTNPKN